MVPARWVRHKDLDKCYRQLATALQKTCLHMTAHTEEKQSWLSSESFLLSTPLQLLIPHKRQNTAGGRLELRSATPECAVLRGNSTLLASVLSLSSPSPSLLHLSTASLLHGLPILAPHINSPGQNGSIPTCLVVEILLNPQ